MVDMEVPNNSGRSNEEVLRSIWVPVRVLSVQKEQGSPRKFWKAQRRGIVVKEGVSRLLRLQEQYGSPRKLWEAQRVASGVEERVLSILERIEVDARVSEQSSKSPSGMG